ncbi:hypothetical protein J6590_082420 [Homalodisca vitripennis]|nr:hypothetical protein J6590_082420 [Homalodisca vitripennis]
MVAYTKRPICNIQYKDTGLSLREDKIWLFRVGKHRPICPERYILLASSDGCDRLGLVTLSLA